MVPTYVVEYKQRAYRANVQPTDAQAKRQRAPLILIVCGSDESHVLARAGQVRPGQVGRPILAGPFRAPAENVRKFPTRFLHG